MRTDVLLKQWKIKNSLRQYKVVFRHADCAKLKISKLNGLLYECQEILEHGPPSRYDKCPTENNHCPLNKICNEFKYNLSSREQTKSLKIMKITTQ